MFCKGPVCEHTTAYHVLSVKGGASKLIGEPSTLDLEGYINLSGGSGGTTGGAV